MVKYKSRKKPKAKKNPLIPSSVKHFLPCEKWGIVKIFMLHHHDMIIHESAIQVKSFLPCEKCIDSDAKSKLSLKVN